MKPSLQDEETNQNSDRTRTTKQHDEIHQTQSQQPLNCPRCNSTNTKFCYFNNYSLTQPRHFCKTCRRYWTNGGALRNVPIGGGCRKKIKKLKSSSSAPVRDPTAFEFFSPSIDFQFNDAVGVGRSCFSLDHQSPITNYSFMGVDNFPPIHQSNINTNRIIASSIESLSSLNQDLHWKLQQRRLAMIFGGNNDHDQVQNKDQNQKLLQPILFHNLEAPKQDGNFCLNNDHHRRNGSTTTEWFFGNSSNYDHQVSGTNNIAGSSGGVQAWGDLHNFTALP